MLIKKEEYIKIVHRPYPPLYTWLILRGYFKKCFRPILGQEFNFRKAIEIDGDWYYLKSTINRLGKLTFDYWMRLSNFNRITKWLIKKENSLMLSVKSNFINFSRAYWSYCCILPSIWAVDELELLEKRIKILLSERLPNRDAEKLFNQIRIPLQDNFYKKEEYDLANCKNLRDVARHVKQYRWIKSRYGNEDSYTFKEAKNRWVKMDKERFFEEWQISKNKIKKAIQRAKNILGEWGYIVDILQFFVYYRTHRTDLINKVAYLFIPKLKEIAQKKNLTYKQLLFCLPYEILGQIPPLEVIDARMRNHAIILDNDKLCCFIGEDYKEIKESFCKKYKRIKQIDKIRGNVAMPGIARGRAKIIFDKNDYFKIKKGDILVTSMTTPDMVRIMKLARAFITDEGGITCHAAIISRELGIPCIIGTKIATKVLKDGDLVEVDAEKGMVKILKNKK